MIRLEGGSGRIISAVEDRGRHPPRARKPVKRPSFRLLSQPQQLEFSNLHNPDTQCNNVETTVQSSPLDPSTPFTGILPLDLTEQAKTAVEEVLRASYRPSTPAFSHLIDDFVQEPDNLFRGPFLSLDLPYTSADIDTKAFPSVSLGYTPYAHQLEAFQRLQPDTPRSTIIATGTGSGKTECFQLPILDWCYQHADQPGIKAIVIYPMNALAEDQARRIATRIWNSLGTARPGHGRHVRGHRTAGRVRLHA